MRARGRREAYELLDAGVGEVYRETFGSALDLGRDALRELGFGAYRAQRAAQRFRRHDVAMLREMAGRRHEIEAMDEYISLTRQRLADVESTLRADLEKEWGAGGGWDTESLRRELGGEDG